MFLSGLTVFIPLIKPIVPMAIKSYTPTPVLSNFFAMYTTSLRLCSISIDSVSYTHIADKFNMLESDVIRALNYWAEQNLITLSYNSQNEISGITLESILRNRYIVKGITSTETNLLASASGQSESIPVPELSLIHIYYYKKPCLQRFNAKRCSHNG